MRNPRRILLISSFVFFLPTIAYGFGPDDVPLFWSLTNNSPTYHDAAFKAQQAFFIQTGITPTFNQINSYVTNKATTTATVFVDKNMPFSSKTLAAVVGTAYAVGIKKQISRSFHNPIWPSVTHDVSVSQNRGSFGIKIPF